MDVRFGTEELEALCTVTATAKRALGQVGTRKLRARLADLAAARTVTELVAGRPHPLRGERSGCFALDLDGGRRLVFRPTLEPTGSLDWSRVNDVTITYIGNYHD
jgi:toxin HigB-1